MLFSPTPFAPYTYVMASAPTDSSFSDEFLLAQIAIGDETALTELYQRFSRRVHALARRILGSVSEADDTCQDVFVKLWERANSFFETRGNAASWIMTIAHHASIDALRRRTSRRTDHPEENYLERTVFETSHDPLEQAMLTKALQVLTASEQELIQLAFFTGLSHSQIARQTELPLGTIKSRLRISLEKLQKILGSEKPLELMVES